MPRNSNRSSSRSKRSAVDTATLLAEIGPLSQWLPVLDTLLPTGVADTQQLQQASGLSRDQVNRLVKRFDTLAPDAILARVKESIPRPGRRGGSPIIYKLGEVGAALLQENGYPDAHACGLEKSTPIAHARSVLDVRLAALAAGLSVQTEKELPYGDDQALRPDNLVILADGLPALFEIEQDADMSLLRRVRDSLRRKVAFFTSEAGKSVSPIIRVLINLPLSPLWDTTVSVWEHAAAIVADEHNGQLPFKIIAIPLLTFLETPDWSTVPGACWESLFDPAQTKHFGRQPKKASTPASQGTAVATTDAFADQEDETLPEPLRRRTASDDRRVMEAYYQHVIEQGPALAYNDQQPRPDRAFFEVMRVIYAASYPEDATPWQLSHHPYASIYLLRKYLALHPALRVALKKAIDRRASRMTWNPTMVMHKMQNVINEFLRYHGFHNSGGLSAYPTSSYNRPDLAGDFRVAVSLHPQMLLGHEHKTYFPRDLTEPAERALAWVLWALFAYSLDIELELKEEYPAFW